MRCFSPNLDAASCISCPEGVCPGDLVCRDGHCVAPGADEDLCSASGGAGGGDAGNSGQGAQAGEAGAPEPDSGGAPGMEITVSSPEFLCTGREFELEASVSGGTEPYSWSATGFPEGTQTRTRDERVTVFLTPPAAGKPDVILRVTDATGLEVERTVNLEVRETPVVETETLPSVCPDEVYSAPLVASGGDEDGYTWETDLSEEETGLGVSGQRLAGHFITDEDEARKTQLELRVESNGCTSAPRTLTLEQNARFADVCPRIKVVSRFGGEPIAGNHGLPAACLGSD
ncbi:MAG TPA: hypothetical protein VGK73_07165, partial [Polyangiaceae bacterium]